MFYHHVKIPFLVITGFADGPVFGKYLCWGKISFILSIPFLTSYAV